ncbi:MAG: head-tail connector protein [Brevundimonas sp.]
MPLVTLQIAKSHLRVTENDEDEYIQSLIDTAEEHISTLTGVSFSDVDRVAVIEAWGPNGYRLPYSPVTSVTGITYGADTNPAAPLSADAFRLSGDRLDLLALPGDRTGPYRVTYKAAVDTPKALRQAALLLIGQWFRNRMAINVGNIVNELPNGVQSLLAPYRNIRV